jgi:hypothetical protein
MEKIGGYLNFNLLIKRLRVKSSEIRGIHGAFHGIPVENHCSKRMMKVIVRQIRVFFVQELVKQAIQIIRDSFFALF